MMKIQAIYTVTIPVKLVPAMEHLLIGWKLDNVNRRFFALNGAARRINGKTLIGKKRQRKKMHVLTTDEIKLILRSKEGPAVLARKINIRPGLVRAVKNLVTEKYTKVAKEIGYKKTPSTKRPAVV